MWNSVKYFLVVVITLAPGSLLTAQEEEEGVAIKYSDSDKEAIQKIQEAGAAILEVAQNDNRLNVAFHLGSGEIGDEQIATVKGLGFIVSLNLRGTKLTDAGLAPVTSCEGLERLHLEKTGVTDAGVKQLAALENLSYLNLYGTAVSDAAIEDIAAIKGLEKVYIFETKITIEGVAALKEKRPELKIIPDLVVDKVKAEAEAVRQAEEAKKAEEEAKKKAEEEAKKKAEEEAAKKKAEEDAKKKE